MPIFAQLPLLFYILISVLTPGPANISTSSLAVLHGFRRTLAYQAGLAVGVFVMMLAAGLVGSGLLGWFPGLEPILRYVGAAYILYLAYSLIRASYHFSEGKTLPLGFWRGLALQISNPKLVVFALTLFTSFLAPLAGSPARIAAAAFVLASVAAAGNAAWALFGAQLKDRLANPRVALWVNIALAAFLVFAAVQLAVG